MSKQPETKNQKKLDAKFYASPEYHELRAKVIDDLQHPRTMVDRACWAKTEQEKVQLKNEKQIWKKLHQRQKTQLTKQAA